jgi:Protein of unknown function (DUF732)
MAMTSASVTPSTNPGAVPGLALLAALVFAVAAMTAVFVLGRHPDLLRPRAATTTSQAESAVPSDPSADPMDRNREFLGRLSSEGLQMQRSNDAAVTDARRICTRYAGGESEPEIIQDMLQGSPGMSLTTASSFADTAISVYCPDGAVTGS